MLRTSTRVQPTRRARSRLHAAVHLALLAASLVLASESAGARSAAWRPRGAPGPGQEADPGNGRLPTAERFDGAVRAAHAAREAGRLEEALARYLDATRLRPDWVEGQWYAGTIAYELERPLPARDAFAHVVRAQEENGPAWAFKGLCEFQLGNVVAAASDLAKSQALGLESMPELAAIATYHRALLLTRAEAYERALQMLGGFARGGDGGDQIAQAMGLALLRLPLLPSEVPDADWEMILIAGRAAAASAAGLRQDATHAFELLVERYASAPSVQYVYGLSLLRDDPDRALAHFRQEVAANPTHVPAMLQIAQEVLKRGEVDEPITLARRAVELAPDNFLARRVLGHALLQSGDAAAAIRELEAAVRLEPESPSARFTLARAYGRAGRAEDARRERAEFSRLERLLRVQRGGANAIGDPESGGEWEREPPP